MRHIISILLENQAGALARVAGLFSSRGYNIESLNVAPTDNEAVSRLTVVTTGSDEVIAQIAKQVGKLVDVVSIVDMTGTDHIERELALFKVRTPESTCPPNSFNRDASLARELSGVRTLKSARARARWSVPVMSTMLTPTTSDTPGVAI